ncbi:MAG: response regulator [Candidatus Omnitrophota bacterium]
MNKNVLSTYQVAKMCQVHHTTVINWVKEGMLKAYATPGGHRRIERDDLTAFLRKYNMPLPAEMKKKIYRILMVDDDPEALWELKEALSSNDLKLDFALNGFEAGRKIYRWKPDLILLDFKMPGMDGFQVCEVLHKDKETMHIPVIAVTVLNSEEDIKKIKKYGVKAYICKPVDVSQLKDLITNTLKE